MRKHAPGTGLRRWRTYELVNMESTSPRAERRTVYRRIVIALWVLLLLGLAGVAAVFYTLSNGDLPDTQQLENPKKELATEILDARGGVLGRLFVENRVEVDYADLSPNLVRALIATEDERYREHSGIDFRALTRAVVKTGLLGDESSGGASTLTQQLAKQMFTGVASRNIVERLQQKLKEWIIAVRLERKYTKEEILAMYLNKVDFLNDGDGIKAASEIYFGKQPAELDEVEAATLVGMLKNPSLYNPMRRPERVKQRREVVLKQMQKNDLLTRAQYDSLRVKPLDMTRFRRGTHTDGPAPYARMVIAEDVKRILAEQTKPDGEPYNVYRDGLRIYTTIDPVIQAEAEAAAVAHMERVQANFWKHWKNLDWWDYREEETTDAAMAARERRLVRMVRESDRFARLRERYLKESLADMASAFPDVKLRDIDIDRMRSEEEEKGNLARLVSLDLISNNMAADYRKALKSPEWAALKRDWESLEAAARAEFDTPVDMKVFAYTDGLEKDTTLTPMDSLKYHHAFLQIGSISIDPKSGHIKSWVGGINHKYFQYDHTRSRRQVGSTFKPLIYATAIQQLGFSPCMPVVDRAETIMPGDRGFYLKEEWTPANSSGVYTNEARTLKDALRSSINTTSVYLLKQIGSVEPVRDLARLMGIETDKVIYADGSALVPSVPSIALGAVDLNVREVSGMYAALANNGLYREPIAILKIEDRNGRTIYQPHQSESLALEPVPNYVMVEMLKYATAGPFNAAGIEVEAGGKTGTTNDHVDGWFMGITPNLMVGTWVGGDDMWVRFRDLRYGAGSKMARPYFIDLINRLEDNPDANFDKKATFPRPSGQLGIELNCDVYDEAVAPLPGQPGTEEGNAPFADPFDDPFGDEFNLPPPPPGSRDTSTRRPIAEDF